MLVDLFWYVVVMAIAAAYWQLNTFPAGYNYGGFVVIALVLWLAVPNIRSVFGPRRLVVHKESKSGKQPKATTEERILADPNRAFHKK